jgi:patatin-like phospholipase
MTQSRKIEEVIESEKEEMGIKDDKPTLGIAISGGGIRSASFGLGVLQAMLEQGKLQMADYLSTVSGGGYIGSALTWFRLRHSGTNGEFFDDTGPFGIKRLGGRFKPTFVNFLQQHGNYITPWKGLNLSSAVAVILRSLLVSVFIYFSFLLALVSVLGLAAQIPVVESMYGILEPYIISYVQKPWAELAFFRLFAVLVAGAGIIFIVTTVLFCLLSISMRLFRSCAACKYPARNGFQRVEGWILTFFVISLVLLTIPIVQSTIEQQIGTLGLIGYLSGVWGALAKLNKFMGSTGFFKKKWIGDLLFRLSAVLFVYAALVIAYHLSLKIGIPAHLGDPVVGSPYKWLGFILAAAGLFGWLLNINDSTVASMYRDRLMEAFLPNDAAIDNNMWKPAKDANVALLETMCRDESGNIRKPYHLINTNIILVGSDKQMYKNRGGDSFLLSPLYCGSDATGFIETESFIKDKSSDNAGMTLATAMATSGAAVNPHTGAGGSGPTRDLFVSVMMTVFNLRLGFWATNPSIGAPRSCPNYIRPGLCSLLGCYGHDEGNKFIELSDGGHFENLGLYELIRRRVDTIVVSDGTADKEFSFGDLANAIERVRADFGVNIRFKPEEEKLGELLPGSFPDSCFSEKFSLAKEGYACGTIQYPAFGPGTAEKKGKIIFIKSTLLPNLPADLYGYKARQPDFPDQSTGDQFFDENQFEAYRELGYRAGEAAAAKIP